MKIARKIAQIGCGIAGVFLCLHLIGVEAIGSEGSGEWRPIYDEVMSWVNFAILAGVVIKFGRKPIMNFLRGQKEEIARQLRYMEEEKKKLTAEIEKAFRSLEESDAHFANIKERIVKLGETRKHELIEDARRQSELMIDMAKRKIDGQIRQAKEAFMAEMIDEAVEIAIKTLPGQITMSDNRKIFNDFLAGLNK